MHKTTFLHKFTCQKTLHKLRGLLRHLLQSVFNCKRTKTLTTQYTVDYSFFTVDISVMSLQPQETPGCTGTEPKIIKQSWCWGWLHVREASVLWRAIKEKERKEFVLKANENFSPFSLTSPTQKHMIFLFVTTIPLGLERKAVSSTCNQQWGEAWSVKRFWLQSPLALTAEQPDTAQTRS